MLEFEVNDMTCGHCVSTITNALKSVDARADVQIDLTRHIVSVATSSNADLIQKAISDAGYTSTLLGGGSKSAVPVAKPGGCGCGCH